MTDLTEQWQKGKLPFGYYYVKFLNGKKGIKKLGEFAYRKLIGKVLAPVPSYEELQAKLEENTKLKTENKWYSEQLNEAVKKIDKLKEQKKLTSDCKTLTQKLLQVKPELKSWLEVNYKDYL